MNTPSPLKYVGRTLYVCMPLKDRRVDMALLMSYLELYIVLSSKGMQFITPPYGLGPTGLHCIAEGGIVLARNLGFNAFLESTATDFLFLDSDIEFHPDAIEALLDSGHEFCAGAYPARHINWEQLFTRIQSGDATTPEEAANLCSPLQVRFGNWVPGITQPTIAGRFIEATEVATGAMLLSRAAVERLAAASVKYSTEGNETEHALIVENRIIELDGKKRFWGEDFTLCYKWRTICQGKVWIDMLSRYGHTGYNTYSSIALGEAIARGQR